jgi:integrase/recombinase XerD
MTHPNHTTTVSPAELYLARRSTEASRATARSALNAAARVLGCDGFEQMDWAMGYHEAALIRAGVNRLEPGWAKVVWTAVRQTTVIARSLRLIDAETASDILDIAAPRGTGDRRGRTPSDDEVAAMLEAAAQDPSRRGRRDAAIVALLAGTGIRRAEASALDRDDVDLVRGLVTIKSGKGRRFRTIPAPPWAVDLLTEWLSVNPSPGPLLRQVDRWANLGGPISGHAVAEVVDRLCDAAHVERCGCHGLRRYAVTDILRRSDVGLARVFAGHADCSTTIRSYDTRGLDDLEAVVRQRSLASQVVGRNA